MDLKKKILRIAEQENISETKLNLNEIDCFKMLYGKVISYNIETCYNTKDDKKTLKKIVLECWAYDKGTKGMIYSSLNIYEKFS